MANYTFSSNFSLKINSKYDFSDLELVKKRCFLKIEIIVFFRWVYHFQKNNPFYLISVYKPMGLY